MSRKIWTLSLLLFTILLLSACSGDQATPEEQLQSYIDHWKKEEFDKMYSMDTHKSKEKYPKSKMSDRYEKIYKELDIKNLKITYKKPDEDKLKMELEKNHATFPIKVKMDSTSGPISFTADVQLKREKNKDGKENWYVNWNPGLIFPEIKDGGSVTLATLPAARGEILDRDKMPLAINEKAYRIGIVPEQFGTDSAKMQKLASLLGISVADIKNQLNQSWVKPNLFVPLKVISENSAALEELPSLSGVTYEETTSRTYPAGPAAAHLVGYVGKINAEELKEKGNDYTVDDMIGKRGLEKQYEDELRGKDGSKIVATNSNGEEKVLAQTDSKDGKNIELTIDSRLQEKIYKSYGGDAGTSAAVNPKTGEVLALVSSPGFDPEEFVTGISSSRLKALEDDPKQPLINRFNLTYAPGSVMKPISAMIGLENGSIKSNETMTINGLEWGKKNWGGYKVRRVTGSGGKPVDVTDALVRSDNIFFARKAVEMGADQYVKGLKSFGFGEEIPFSYPIKRSQISNNGKLDNEVLLANTIYGQGEIQLSSLHVALAYAPIINNGIMPKPLLLSTDEKGKAWHENLLSKEHADVMQKALRKVVTDGTAAKAKNAKVAISGKTGTAELKKSQNSTGHENSWFTAYPTKEKNVVISMMVEKAEGRGHIVVERVSSILSSKK
ncbi:penicillin-binding transpeptidase domain-containing protein [Aciduricibacillus chroicocephali]|uniref:serine-type D-Ala-D-Ala carboxypeptidase n=1 Tax=Aciduricibacillus chroicocephali TaxID=3054939 RepID=A0ABY9KSW4_9BACI|nr:penicillin-binding transpeptidase domain-containing protein [Bacillaceae bacterium 44XB]